jgi:hypothetical protein
MEHVELAYADLDGERGMWTSGDGGDLIVLSAALGRRARRCVLAHEIVHAERGIGFGAASAATMQREEEEVRREVARRLVPSDELLAFLASRGGVGPVTVDDIADEFDVEPHVAATAVTLLRYSSVCRPISSDRLS